MPLPIGGGTASNSSPQKNSSSSKANNSTNSNNFVEQQNPQANIFDEAYPQENIDYSQKLESPNEILKKASEDNYTPNNSSIELLKAQQERAQLEREILLLKQQQLELLQQQQQQSERPNQTNNFPDNFSSESNFLHPNNDYTSEDHNNNYDPHNEERIQTEEGNYKIDPKTGVKYEVLPKTVMGEDGNPVAQIEGFDVWDMQSEANRFLGHLRVPNKNE